MSRLIAVCAALFSTAMLCAGCASVATNEVAETSSLAAGTNQTAQIAPANEPRESSDERPAPKRDAAADLIRLASDIESRGDKSTAIVLYERAVSVSGTRSDTRLALAAAYERAERGDEAMKVYQDILEREPENGLALVFLGSAQVKRGNLEQGVTALTKAAPLLKNAGAYDRLGVAQTLAGRPQEAVVSLQRARELAPGDLDVNTNLALALALADKLDAAVALMTEVTRQPRAAPHHRRNLVLVLGLASKDAEALTLASADLPKSEIQKLLSRAQAIRKVSNPKERARALGTIL